MRYIRTADLGGRLDLGSDESLDGFGWGSSYPSISKNKNNGSYRSISKSNDNGASSSISKKKNKQSATVPVRFTGGRVVSIKGSKNA